ncbi:hypothetical protein ACLMJK_003294 [Lecanora helva]
MGFPIRTVVPAVTLLCSTVAFILALCCLLSGTNPNTLQGMELYNLNTSMVGPSVLKDLNLPPPNSSINMTSLFKRDVGDDLNNAASKIQSAGKSAATSAGHAVQSAGANVQDELNEAKEEVANAVKDAKNAAISAASTIVSTAINETIKNLDIQEFYTAHLLTYCEGNYTTKGEQNITYCSNGSPDHRHNETGQEHPNNTPLAFIENLHLPDPLGLGMSAVGLVYKLIAAFYILGIIATFSTLLISTLALAASTRAVPSSGKVILLGIMGMASSAVAFFCLLLGTAMTHFLVKRICDFFCNHPKLGVVATRGTTFDGCSWAAVALMGVVVVGSVADVTMGVMGRFRKDPVRDKAFEMEQEYAH